MTQESRATLEIIAPTIEEAVEKGLKEFGVSRDRVEVEVLDEGSKGLFGLGNRQARVRLALLNDEEAGAAKTADTQEEQTTSADPEIKESPKMVQEGNGSSVSDDDEHSYEANLNSVYCTGNRC